MMDSYYARSLHWARLLAFVTGLVNQELVLRNQYSAAENRIHRARLSREAPAVGSGAIHLGRNRERLGLKALNDIAHVAKPDTILSWYRQLVARKFDGSRQGGNPGRPRVSPEVEELVDISRARIDVGMRPYRGRARPPGA